MSNRYFLFFLLPLFLFILPAEPVEGAYVIRDGRLINKKHLADKSLEEHFADGVAAMETKRWSEAEHQFKVVIVNFPKHIRSQEALFYLGKSRTMLQKYADANRNLTNYLKLPKSSDHSEEALQLKLAIAEAFRNGAKKHLFGIEGLPKWVSAKENALDIYEEVIAALPTSDLAARALFSKGLLCFKLKEYQETAEMFNLLIQRFPNHPLVPEGYLNQIRAIRQEGRPEHQNSDLLALAALKVKRFRQHFPREERLKLAEQELFEMQEDYARGLFKVARFYDRVKAPASSVICYVSLVNQFPESSFAEPSRQRIKELQEYVERAKLKVNTV